MGDDDYNLVQERGHYREHVPDGWYPVGGSHHDDLFCIDRAGGVWVISLADEPAAQGTATPLGASRLADDFERFLGLLTVPDWARNV